MCVGNGALREYTAYIRTGNVLGAMVPLANTAHTGTIEMTDTTLLINFLAECPRRATSVLEVLLHACSLFLFTQTYPGSCILTPLTPMGFRMLFRCM